LGIAYTDLVRDGSNHQISLRSADAILTITYVIPIVPNIATNDGVTSGDDLTYDWTFGFNMDNSTQPAITNSSVYVGNTAYPFTPIKNYNATQETDIGKIITSSNFEGIFHFDPINTINPDSISGLKLWFDASDSSTITKDGGNLVSVWGDKAVNGDNLSQATGSDQPLWVDNVQNGLPVIKFDGSNDNMNTGTLTATLSQPNTYVGVFRMPTGSGAEFTVWDSEVTGTRNLFVAEGTVNAYRYYAGDTPENSAVTLDKTDFQVYTIVFDNTSSSIRRGQVEILSSGTAIGTNGLPSFKLGEDWSNIRNGDVWFGELLVYNKALTTQEREDVESYLIEKWNVSGTPLGNILDYSGNDNHAIITNIPNVVTPTIDDDLGTTAHTSNNVNVNNWYANDYTEILLDGNNEIDFIADRDGSPDVDGIVRDNTSSYCGTTCVVQFNLDIDTINVGSVAPVTGLFVGIFDKNETFGYEGTTNQHSMSLFLSTTNTVTSFYNAYGDSGEGLGENNVSLGTMTTGTWCAEMIRDSASLTWNLYNQESCSGTPTFTAEQTMVGTIDAGQWVGAKNNGSDDTSTDASIIGSIRNVKIFEGVTSVTSLGTAVLKTSSIDTRLSYEVQFKDAGLNITNANIIPTGTSSFTWNGIITNNGTEPITVLSFVDTGVEFLCNVGLTFIGCSVGGTDVVNGTLSTSMNSGSTSAVTIEKDSSDYEIIVNGTSEITNTDSTNIGTPDNDLIHIGFDSSLGNSQTWRLDELAIESTVRTNGLDYSERINPFNFLTSVSQPTTTYDHIGLSIPTTKCFFVTIWNSIGESDESFIECGTTFLTTILQDAINDIELLYMSGTTAILNWTQPLNPGVGNITGYQINFTTPFGDPLSFVSSNTGNTDHTIAVTDLNYNTQYSFRGSAITEHGINVTGANIANGTTSIDLSTVNATIGAIDIDAINPLRINPISFTRTDTSNPNNEKDNSVLVNVTYPGFYDLNCNVDQKFSNTNANYTSMNGTAISGSENQVSFNFTNTSNEVVTLRCYDSVTGVGSTFVITNDDFVLLDVLADLRSGEYGSAFKFGELDMITLLILIISMIAFNRKDPTVGLIMNIIIILSAGFFGFISFFSVMLGATVTALMFFIFSKRAKP